jgi:spore coat protein CotH
MCKCNSLIFATFAANFLKMKKLYLLFILTAIVLAACQKSKKEIIEKTDDSAAITTVKIEAKNNPGVTADINATINGDNEIVAVLPDINASKNLVLTFTTATTGTVVKADNIVQVSGETHTDFSKPVTYTLETPDGHTATYTVLIKVFTGIPIFNITTSAPVTSKEDYVKGSITINANLSFPQEITNMTLQIRGHGNSSWSEFPKKPYKIKLDSKAAMLGMPAAKNWVLLANYNDKTLMRNRIALDLGRALGSDFTSDSRYVEVFMNGEFLGNYLLTAHVEVNPNRVNITELTDKNTSDEEITGGYLLELDQRKDEDFWFVTKQNLPFTIKSPEEITPKQFDYIHNYVQQAEDALFGADFSDPEKGYAKYLDADSFIRWYFVEEILQNEDGRDFSSMFYYKERGGKLGMGPLWDFDLSSGNIGNTVAKDPTGIWYVRDATWMSRLAQDPTFILKVRKRWSEIKDKEVKQLFADIDQTAAYLQLSQKQNFIKWPILSTLVWRNAVALGSYDKEVAYMKDFITQRVNWMDANMAEF